jgi:hypothetical protein
MHASEDPSLHGTILPERAVLSVDAGAGEIALHLRVKDGVADVRVVGSAAEGLDVQQHELRAALASEGLSLGSFESGQSPSRQPDVDHSDRTSDAHPHSRAVAAISATTTTVAADAGRDATTPSANAAARGLHVTA